MISMQKNTAIAPVRPAVPLVAHQLRVRVHDADSGAQKISVTIPLDLVEAGMKLGARLVPDEAVAEKAAIIDAVRLGRPGPVVTVAAPSDREVIHVSLE
jgi:hypothetical protein